MKIAKDEKWLKVEGLGESPISQIKNFIVDYTEDGVNKK
jgi:hypothetical protein